MTRIVRRPFGFPGKLALITVLALAAGFLWAMADSGKSFADVARMIAPGPPPAPPPAATPPRNATPTGPTTPGPLAPAPTAPLPVPSGPIPYSAEKMASFFDEVDVQLRRGRIKEARELLRRQNATLVPAVQMEKFRRVEEDLNRYHQLFLETVGATLDLPLIAELDLRSGGALVVKNLQETESDYRFETLNGIRSRIPKSTVMEVRRAPKERGGVFVDEELEKQASYRAIRIEKKTGPTGVEWTFSDAGQAPGTAYFELADFCARNGRNSRIVPLFAAGLKRDPDLVRTVFERKAELMVDTFLYFITIRAKEDARDAYNVLTQRYRNSKAYRGRIEGDEEIRHAYADLFDTAIASAPKPEKPSTEGPAPEDPTPPPDNEPEPPPAPPAPPAPGVPPAPPPTPPPAAPKPPPKPVDEDPDRVDGAEPTILPPDAPSRAVELVKKGDELFKQAMKHILNSDSSKNPTGWIQENRKALDLLKKAHDTYYYPAQEVFEKAKKPNPTSLLRRVRQVQMTRAMCRKRDVASR